MIPRFYHCGICEYYHSVHFDGDCRDDGCRLDVDELDSEYGVNGWIEMDMNDLEGEYEDDGMSDAEADADTLRMAGWGTDEDYGFYGNDDF